MCQLARDVRIRANLLNRLDSLFYFSIIVGFSLSLSLGSKGGVVGFVPSLAVACIVYLSYSRRPFWKILHSKKLFLFSLVSVVLLVVGYFRATPGRMTVIDFFGWLWCRLFVTSTETIAAAISYFRDVGFWELLFSRLLEACCHTGRPICRFCCMNTSLWLREGLTCQ